MAGYSPWGHKNWDRAERLRPFYTFHPSAKTSSVREQCPFSLLDPY